MEEVWKPVPEFIGYEVSNKGRVRSYYKFGNNQSKLFSEPQSILKSSPKKSGYLHVTLIKNRERHEFLIHSLVTLTFIGPCPEGMEVCHWDDVKSNNHIDNLRYDTTKGNREDAVRNGKTSRGEHRFNAKLTEALVVSIRTEYAMKIVTQRELALRYNVDETIIGDVVCGRLWKHCGGPIKDVDYKIRNRRGVKKCV